MTKTKAAKGLRMLSEELTALRAAAVLPADVATVEHLLKTAARKRLAADLGENPLYVSIADNITVLCAGDARRGSVRSDCLVFPGATVQRRQWVADSTGHGRQTTCTFRVEADGTYSAEVPALQETFTGPTEADVRAQLTDEGVWRQWMRRDGRDSKCIKFGFELPAMQALMVAAQADVETVDAAASCKRARVSPAVSPVSACAALPPVEPAPVRTAWAVSMSMPSPPYCGHAGLAKRPAAKRALPLVALWQTKKCPSPVKL